MLMKCLVYNYFDLPIVARTVSQFDFHAVEAMGAVWLQ